VKLFLKPRQPKGTREGGQYAASKNPEPVVDLGVEKPITVVHEHRDESGRLHNESGPAVEYSDGSVEYRVLGKRHRDGDEPAIVRSDGTLEYYKNGRRHRDRDQPAFVDADGTTAYFKNGDRHRDRDQPAFVDADGTSEWFQNDQRHRDGDRPAFVGADGTEIWFSHDERHREIERGPAVVRADGKKSDKSYPSKRRAPHEQRSTPAQG
jgi:hypothetical protein